MQNMKWLAVITCISLLSVVKSQENLSSNGTVSQSSTYYYRDKEINMTADLAITGGPTDTFYTGSCAVTGYPNPDYFAWWMLTFPVDTVYVTNVRIYYRHNTAGRLAGYSLFISNSSTSKTDGYLCYHHTGPYIPSVYQNVNCNHLGQYVIIYNERKETLDYPSGYSDILVLELCYVQIYGCYKGWWNIDCSKPCPVNCVSGHCYPGNGSCVWGCNPDHCLSDVCDTVTGVCTDGCKIGLDGDSCDRACESGKYGNGCSGTCHCFNQPCDPMHGMCPPGGCTRGYKGLICSTECSLGYYGYNCNKSCDGCLSDACDKKHGVCIDTSGCKPGWQPGHTKCDLECITGTFGINCESRCDTCINRICDRFDGKCTYGCIEGFKGDRCHLSECITGTYGINCESQCDTCVHRICDKRDGKCIYGCIEGFKGDNCHLKTDISATSKSATSYTAVYTGVGSFVVTALLCFIIVLATLRYRRNKKDRNTKQQNGNKTREFDNDAFTNDYANIGANSTETHYVETIPVTQEQPYDTI